MSTKIYVNFEWTDEAVFNSDMAKPEGLVWGVNAFGNLNFPLDVQGTAINIISGTYSNAEGVYDSSVSLLKNDIVTVSAENVVVDKGSLIFQTDVAGQVSISGNFTTTDKVRYTGTWGVDWTESQNGHIRFVGGDETEFLLSGNFTAGENIQFIGGKVVITEDSVLKNDPANWGQYLINGAEVINYGSMSLDLNAVNGSAMNILGGGSLTLSGEKASLSINMKDGGATNKDINVTNGSLIVEEGASLNTTGAVTVAAAGVVDVSGADIEVAALVNNGTINVDADSTITAGTLTGDGTIVIDATGLDTTKSIINISGTESLAGKVTVENLAEGFRVVYGKDGDVILTDADMTTIFVDPELTAENLAEGQFLGINAFTSFADALGAVTDTTEKITVNGTFTEAGPDANTTVTLSKDLTISGGNVTWDSIGGWVYFAKAEGVEADVKLTFEGFDLVANDAKKAFFFDVDTVIDGDSSVSLYNAKISSASTVEVLAGGEFNVYKEELQIDADSNLVITGSEDFSAADAELADRQMFLQYSRNVKGAINLTDSYAASYQGFYIRDNGSITADNSLIEIGNDAAGVWHYNPVSNGYGELRLNSENAVMNLNNGSILKISGNITNAGTLNIDNSTFVANGSVVSDGVIKDAQNTGTFTNNGTINVSGESKLVIRDLAGNVIDFAEGTTLVDSDINYTGSNSFRFDGVTFEGDNTINSTAYATSGMSFTIAEGASLKSTGGRWALGGTGVWDINGTIENAKELTAEEKAELTASLDVNGLSLSTGGGEAVMNVTNAYFTYGSGHITTKNTNAFGGKIVMNFTNSVVESAYKYSVNPTKAGYDAANAPEVVLNVTGSVFKINNYFTNNHAKGTVNVDNSDLTATAFGNVGTFSAVNGSVVNFSLVNNALGDWAGKGSLNAGSMLIDDSTLNIVNKTASLEFYNVGEITLANGAVLTLDRLVNAEANDLTGAGNINTTFADMVGNITIDETSKINVSTLFTNNGTITIDVTDDWKGVATIIDAVDGTTDFGEIVLNEADAANGLATRIDAATGELMIYSVDTDTIFVNSAWADGDTAYAFGEEVAEGKFYGINAFTSLDEALKAGITYGGAAIELLDETLVTENLQKVVTKMHGASGMDFSITGTSAGNEFIAIEMRDDDSINPDEDFTELATLVIKDAQLNSYKIAAYENSKITIENSTIDFHGDQNGPLYTKGNGEIYVKDSVIDNTVQISAMGAAMEFDNSTLNSGSAAQISGEMTFKNGSTYTLSSAKIYGGTGVLTIEDSTMVRKAARTAADKANALVYYINGAANIPTALADYAYCVFVGGSQYSTTAHTGTGVMNVTNSTFDISAAYADENYADIEGYENSKGLVGVGVGSTLTITNSTFNTDVLMNEGAITIDALSTLTATTLTNSGTITIDAKGYTGDSVKIIDLDQDSALTGVKLTGNSNYVLRYENDGDVILAKAPEYVYVSSDYNSTTEGWGYDKFSNYDSAVAFAKNNAPKATIVMEKTTTISGNCVKDKSEDLGVDMTNTLVIQDGAVMGNAQSKWDMTYAVTIEAGGILQSGRPASAGYGNTHIKNKLTIGEADSEKRAEIRFINSADVPYKTMSIALLSGFNRSITANNALIEVGDLGLQANASFTDTTLTIEGILAIRGTSLYKTTMTNTTATVKGHNLMNENTYYSTVGTILATLTMDNSSITVDDGVDDTAAETVWLGYTTNTAQTLTLTNGSTVTIEKDALAKVANKVTVTDSAIYAGDVDASAVKAVNSSFYFNQLEKGKVYYAVLYDAEGNELETIVRTSTSGSTFYPKFSAQPVGDYKAVCYTDEAKTQIHQEKTYSFTAVGTVDLVNSDFYAEKLLLAGGNVTMDINSTLGFSSVEGGYITVTDAASYVDNEGQSDGTYLIFDYTGDAEMTVDDYKALLNDQWHDNYTVFNNDLYLTDQELGTVYVDTAWKGLEAGDVTPEGYIYGFNAASALEEVGSMIATDGSDTTVKFAGDLEAGSVVFNYGSGDITFTADEKVTIKQNSVADWDFAVGDVDSTITIGENVTFQINENASGMYVYYGAGLNVEGTVTGGENWGCLYLAYGDHTVADSGTVSVGRTHLAWTTLTVNGDAESDRTDAHLDNNYLLVEESIFTANNAIINVGAVHDSNNGGLRYGASEFNINNSDFTANTVTLKHADTEFTVTGESKINIGTLTGTITLDNAALTDSVINKGYVNLKGDNTFAGDFNAAYAFVGDWNNGEYDASVDFGTDSNVNVGGQMIIGYDSTVADANSVVFGDVTGETVTDKVFKAADVSVRRDGTLTIANTTGENKINTMNVMGSVIIDNAKLTGEVQIGNSSDDIDAVMTVQNGAEVTLGGSSNSVVILGKSNGGILNVDDATVTVKRAGAGASYRVPDDTFVIGYNGGAGVLNVANNGKFITADFNGEKDGGMMNVELNTGSVINVTDGGSVEVSGNVNNSGKITVDGGSLSAAGMDVQAQLRITGLTKGEARTIKVSLIKEGETSGTIVELDVAADATEAVLYLTEYADGNYSATVIDGTSTFNTAVEVVNGVLTVADGTLDIAGTLALNMSKLNVSGESTLNIATLSGTAYAADGTTLVDSNVGGTVVMEGDLAVTGESYIKTISSTLGGTLSVEEGKTLALNNFSFGSKDNADAEYTITGGNVTANYGFFQHGTYTLESDFETGYMYYSYGSDITVKGTFHSKGTGDGLDYVRGKLTIAETGATIHDKSLWIGQPESWGEMSASMTVEGVAKANSISVYAGSSLSVNGGTVEAVTVNNTGDFNVAGDVTLNIGTFNGVLTVNGDTVFSADTAVTVKGSVNADGYTVTMKQGAILGAENFTADKLILTDVVLPTDQAITIYDGATDIDELVINGSNVVDGTAVIDGVQYDVVTGDTGITMNVAASEYDPMEVKLVDVRQSKGSYEFTVSVEVTGGVGDYTYQIIDENGNVIADGLSFTVSGTPESSILNIGVKVFDSYGETTAVVTAPIFVPVRDYDLPVIGEITASTTAETTGKVVLTADITDNFDAAVADNLTVTYSTDGGKTWNAYNDGVTVVNNCTVIFKAEDAEGNVTTKEFVVDNIVSQQDYDRNGLADTLFVHDNKLTSAWFSVASDSEITLTDLAVMDDNMALLGSGRIYGSANDGSDIFYTDGTTVKAWDVQNGVISGEAKDIWKIDANREILGIGDFNGDGASDVLIKSGYGDVGAIFANADGSTTWNYFSSLGDEWKLSAIGDFNGDGLDDVVLHHTEAGFAGAWLTQEDGSVKWSNLDNIAGGEVIGAGDFNGDDIDDVLIRKDGWVGAWITDENGNATKTVGFGSITATVEQIGDFNGDGIDDIRVRDDNMIGVITVGDNGSTQWKEFIGVGDEWKSSTSGLIC